MQFFIKSKLNDMGIDICNGESRDGAELITWPIEGSGGANQRWSLVRVTDDGYMIQSELNGMAIDIGGNYSEPAAPLITSSTGQTPGWSQLWTLTPTGDGYVSIANKTNGFVIDISGNNAAAGARLISYPAHATPAPNQLWRLVPTDANLPTGTYGPQVVRLDVGRKFLMVAHARSTAPQSVVVRNSRGDEVFSAHGAETSGTGQTEIGRTSFVTTGDGRYTIEMTPRSASLFVQNSPFFIVLGATTSPWLGDFSEVALSILAT